MGFDPNVECVMISAKYCMQCGMCDDLSQVLHAERFGCKFSIIHGMPPEVQSVKSVNTLFQLCKLKIWDVYHYHTKRL